MTPTLKLEVGKRYENGFGAVLTIVKAPTAKCRWFEDETGSHYHEDGAAVRVNGEAHYNFVEEFIAKASA